MTCCSRRQALLACGVVAGGAALLAACGPGREQPQAPTGESLGTLADLGLDVGASTSVDTSTGAVVLLTRTGEDEVVAFSAVCTHQGCTVRVDGEDGYCPCHGSRFDLLTGAATVSPATESLAAIAVEVREGEVFTA